MVRKLIYTFRFRRIGLNNLINLQNFLYLDNQTVCIGNFFSCDDPLKCYAAIHFGQLYIISLQMKKTKQNKNHHITQKWVMGQRISAKSTMI